jgi:pyridoxal 5'-phosphate synthase pdxT subunit
LQKVGVLALQGDFYKHIQAIKKLHAEPILVKDESSLQKCDKLIIPGGESTTFIKLIDRLELRDALITFGIKKPVFGTCAGLIILSSSLQRNSFEPLNLINLQVERNAYGRQIDSFIDTVQLSFGGQTIEFEAVFIRAPKIIECLDGSEAVAWHGKDIVMAANKNILVATFHPELTDDLRIHKFFLNHFA